MEPIDWRTQFELDRALAIELHRWVNLLSLGGSSAAGLGMFAWAWSWYARPTVADVFACWVDAEVTLFVSFGLSFGLGTLIAYELVGLARRRRWQGR
jgi:hypothetical protein